MSAGCMGVPSLLFVLMGVAAVAAAHAQVAGWLPLFIVAIHGPPVLAGGGVLAGAGCHSATMSHPMMSKTSAGIAKAKPIPGGIPSLYFISSPQTAIPIRLRTMLDRKKIVGVMVDPPVYWLFG